MKIDIMRHKTLYILVIGVLIGCKSKEQSNAEKQASDIEKMVKQTSPGTIPTSATGYMMTAFIDGKEWKATAMYPPERAGLIVGVNNGESISLPYYDRRSFASDKIRKLKGIDLRLNDDIKLWTGFTGEMEITKIDDKSAEGTFYFTAKGFQSDKTIEVTKGFFRILFK